MFGKCYKCHREAELEGYKGKHFCKMCALDIRFNDRHKNDFNNISLPKNNSSKNVATEKIENDIESNSVVKENKSLLKILSDIIEKLYTFIKFIIFFIRLAIPLTALGTILGIFFGYLRISDISILIPLFILSLFFYNTDESPEERKKSLEKRRKSLEELEHTLKDMAEYEKEKAREKIEYEIEILKRERDSLTTGNSYGGFLGGNLDENELEYNRRKKSELTRQIDDLEYRLRNIH